jgi:hypothetical protein
MTSFAKQGSHDNCFYITTHTVTCESAEVTVHITSHKKKFNLHKFIASICSTMNTIYKTIMLFKQLLNYLKWLNSSLEDGIQSQHILLTRIVKTQHIS